MEADVPGPPAFQPARPVRAAAIGAGVIALLFAVTTPLIGVEVHPVLWVFGGSAYGIVLCTVAVGVGLALSQSSAPGSWLIRRLPRLLLLWGPLGVFAVKFLLLLMLAVGVWILPKHAWIWFEAVGVVLDIALPLITLWLAAFVSSGIAGWVMWFRREPDSAG